MFRGDAAHYHVKAEGRHPALSQLVLQGSAAGGHSGSPVFKGDVTTWPVLLACGGEKGEKGEKVRRNPKTLNPKPLIQRAMTRWGWSSRGGYQ